MANQVWARSLMASLLCALGASAWARTLEFDTNADGIVDLRFAAQESDPVDSPMPGSLEDRNDDGTLEWASAPSLTDPAARGGSSVTYEEVWDSGSTLSVLWTVEAGDADMDSRFDFAGGHFAPNVMFLFEADGAGGYAEVWNSSAQTPPGAYRDIAFGDSDGDGLGEVMGGEVSTLGKVMLFEQTVAGAHDFAFLHDTVRESDFSGGSSMRRLFVADTDLDGKKEIIVIKGGSSPTSGLVAIWEHSGATGVPTYTRVFSYQTVSYIFGAGLGDSDNDGVPEIILGLGGFGGNPLIIRRVEYISAQGTWVHQQFTSSVIGLPLTPHVADLNGDGSNELIYGSEGNIVAYTSTGENEYTLLGQSAEVMNGTTLAVATHRLLGTDRDAIVAGSFGGDYGVWSWDDSSFERLFAQFGVGGAVRRLEYADDGADGREEIVLAIDTIEQIQVHRRVEDPASTPQGDLISAALLAFPNPTREHVALSLGILSSRENTVRVFDPTGRRLRDVPVSGGTAHWDGRDDSGVPLPAGLYLARAGGETARILLVR